MSTLSAEWKQSGLMPVGGINQLTRKSEMSKGMWVCK